MTEKLKAVIKHIVDFDEEQLNIVARYFKQAKFKRGEIILAQGDVCNKFYFVFTGCIRTGFLTNEGDEKTRYVMLQPSIGTALTSFISQKPSFEFIDALEDSEVLFISHKDFYRLNNEMDNWRLFYQRILEMAYSFQNRKIEALVTMDARQRYLQLLKENPMLIQKLTNKVLASYLDMSQETLSRIKSK